MNGEICRLCLAPGIGMQPIFDMNDDSFLLKLIDIVRLELHEGDGLPSSMCQQCCLHLISAFNFKQRCIWSDRTLRTHIMQARNSPELRPYIPFSPVLLQEGCDPGFLAGQLPVDEDSFLRPEIDPLLEAPHEQSYLQQVKTEPIKLENVAVDQTFPKSLVGEQAQGQSPIISETVPLKREFEVDLIDVQSDSELSKSNDEEEDSNIIECYFDDTKAYVVLNRVLTKDERALLEEQLFIKVPVVKLYLLDESLFCGTKEGSDRGETTIDSGEDFTSDTMEATSKSSDYIQDTIDLFEDSTSDSSVSYSRNSDSSHFIVSDSESEWSEGNASHYLKDKIDCHSSYKKHRKHNRPTGINITQVALRSKRKKNKFIIDSEQIPEQSVNLISLSEVDQNIHTRKKKRREIARGILDSKLKPDQSDGWKSSSEDDQTFRTPKMKRAEVDATLNSDPSDELKSPSAEKQIIHTLITKVTETSHGILDSKIISKQSDNTESLSAIDRNIIHTLENKTTETVDDTLEAGTGNQCPICKETFSDAISLNLHNKEHKRLLTCCACGKILSMLGNLQTHKNTHQAKVNFKCKLCPKRFLSLSTLLIHSKVHYEGENVNDKLFCYVCHVSFNYYKKLAEHYSLLHLDNNDYKCKKCDRSYDSAYELKLHRIQHNRNGLDSVECLSCPSCNKTFSTSQGLKIHIGLQHRPKPVTQPDSNVADVESFLCPSCNKAFSTPQGLKIHIGVQHQLKPVTQPDSNVADAESFLCTSCNQTFNTFNGLRIHIGVQHRAKPFKQSIPNVAIDSFLCKSCDKTFNTFNGLRIHIGVQHRGKPVQQPSSNVAVENVSCPFCDKTFSTCQGLKIHFGLQHSEKPVHKTLSYEAGKSLSCPSCNKTFETYKGLKIHVRLLHRLKLVKRPNSNVAGERVSCPSCNKTFETVKGLKIHVQLLHRLKLVKEPHFNT